MITNLFLNVIALSVSTSLVIILLLLFSSFLNQRYAIKWKYLMWVVIAVRLILPFHIDIPFPQMVITVPTEITVPVDTENKNDENDGTDAPAMAPIEQEPLEADPGNAVQAPSRTARKSGKLTWLDMIAYLWLAGCLLFLSVHIFSFLHYKRQIAKKGMAVEERDILQQARKISRELQMKPNIKILRYQGADSPMAIGLLKPGIVLPDCDYSEEELFFILKHELTHIKRHDIYFKLLFVMANALHWFNPFVYVMQREAAVDMELSCDERVIRQTSYAVRKAYTEALLSTFGRQRKKTSFTTQFYGGKNIMKKRFKNILARPPKKNGLFVCICTICVTFISGMLIGCSAIKSDSPEEPIQTDLETLNPGISDASDTRTEDHNAQAEDQNIQTEDHNAQVEDYNAQAGSDSVQADKADGGSPDLSSDTPNGSVEKPTEQSLPSGGNLYRSILLGKSDFICTDLGNKSLNISEIGQVITDDESDAVNAVKFAVLDLDADGEDEIILWLQNGTYDCGFEILHAQSGEVYGYTLWYRAFMELKADGTFEFSGGAADSGIGKLNFSETGYSVDGQAYSQSSYDANNELAVQYFIDHEPCSENEFYDRINAQEQKADAEWFDLSEDNVNAVL